MFSADRNKRRKKPCGWAAATHGDPRGTRVESQSEATSRGILATSRRLISSRSDEAGVVPTSPGCEASSKIKTLTFRFVGSIGLTRSSVVRCMTKGNAACVPHGRCLPATWMFPECNIAWPSGRKPCKNRGLARFLQSLQIALRIRARPRTAS